MELLVKIISIYLQIVVTLRYSLYTYEKLGPSRGVIVNKFD